MLFHMSIAAQAPRHVAEVFAELWGGEAFAFPPVAQGSWIALAGDERGTAIEVYPADVVLRESEGDADARGEYTGNRGYTATHAAIATDLTSEAVFAIARREGWPAKYRKRGDIFGVIEMWVEGMQMIEVLPPEMQQEYLASMKLEDWRAMRDAMAPRA
jgi:hypothetical protein